MKKIDLVTGPQAIAQPFTTGKQKRLSAATVCSSSVFSARVRGAQTYHFLIRVVTCYREAMQDLL